MGEKRNAPGRGATCPGAGRGVLSGQGSPSPAHSTASSSPRQERRGRVATVLPTGKGNALPGREIARLLGFRSAREVSAAVERERRLGLPICASCDAAAPGYYMPESPEELTEYLGSLRRRRRAVGRTATAREESLAAWEGQGHFKLPDGGEEV